jgi:hypothetical protein
LLHSPRPFAAWGQQAGREYRIVVGFVQGDELTRRLTGVIRQRLASHGFVEGKNRRRARPMYRDAPPPSSTGS